jgi:hypothetical protein
MFRGSLHFLDLSVRVLADCEEAWAQIRRRYPHWLHENADGEAAVDLQVSYDARIGGGVVHDGETSTAFASWSGGLLALQLAIDSIVVRGLGGCALLHAGVVRFDGALVVLPGPSWSGKSSLVAALVERGAVYYSDEFAVLEGDGCVRPYQRPLIRREAGRVVHESSVPMLPPGTLGGKRPDLILFVPYRESASLSVQEMGKDRAVMELLKNTPHTWRDRPEIVPIFAKAVSAAATYCGQRGEAAEVVEWLCETIRARSEVIRGNESEAPRAPGREYSSE